MEDRYRAVQIPTRREFGGEVRKVSALRGFDYFSGRSLLNISLKQRKYKT